MANMTRREFIRGKRRSLKKLRAALNEVSMGCAMREMFDGTQDFYSAFLAAEKAYKKMDEITKPLT